MGQRRQFWMVYGIGQRAPSHEHPSEGSALDEAKRLARANPGITFCVLEATHAVLKNDVHVRRLGTAVVDDDIPF